MTDIRDITSKPAFKFGCCCFFLVFIASAIMVGASFSILEPLEMGIEYSTTSRSIDDERVYLGGRHFLGLGKAFFKYPVTEQNIAFTSNGGDSGPLRIQVASGAITIDCSFQYQLDPLSLIEIYRRYAQNYHGRFVQFGQSVFNTHFTKYSPQQFYDDRRRIQEETLTALRDRFAAENIQITNFQLRRAILPPDTEALLIQRFVRTEERRSAANVQLQVAINAQTAVNTGAQRAQTREVVAELERNAEFVLNEARADAERERLGAVSRRFENVQNRTGWSGGEMLRYLWTQQLRNPATFAGTKVALGFQQPSA